MFCLTAHDPTLLLFKRITILSQPEQSATQIEKIRELCHLYRIHVDEVRLLSLHTDADAEDVELRCHAINRVIHKHSADHAFQVYMELPHPTAWTNNSDLYVKVLHSLSRNLPPTALVQMGQTVSVVTSEL